MEKHLRYKSRQLVLITLSLLAIVLAVRLGMSSVLSLEQDTASLERSVSLDGGNAEASYRLARLYQLNMTGDEETAEELYVNSISRSPLLAASWLGLTELFIESGEAGKAKITLERSDEIIPSSVGLLWESSMLSFSLGETRQALGKLRKVADADPARRQGVFDICWDLGNTPRSILDIVVSDEVLPDYLQYLIAKDQQADTYPVWKRMERAGSAADSDALVYVEYLINKNDIATAKGIWDGLYPDSGRGFTVWNGGFEQDTDSRGFNWKIDMTEGVEIDYDYKNKTEGKRSLRLEFSGENNVEFLHVRQFVPVEPSSHYLLTSYIATDSITTRNGIAWEVYCPGLDAVSEVYTGTVDWTTAQVAFDTPPGCNYVDIRVRRFKSDKLDNLISGEAWIDNVNLINLGPATDV